MKLFIIACSVLKNEFLATNPDGIHIEFLEQGLHQTPDKMRLVIQEKIDEVNGGGFDYIVLGYGLCGNGTLGIQARDIPIVIPKAHDCITYWLGSLEGQQEHNKAPASYYLTKGWVEEAKAPIATFNEYKERYGDHTAAWLIREMFKNYSRIVLIDTGAYDPDQYCSYARENADILGVNYEEIQGSLALFDNLMKGKWENNSFIIIRPGEKIAQNMFFS